MISGTSPLSRLEPIEDSECAVRYLSDHVEAHGTIYVHASMREQFKFYSRLTPVHSSKVVWGKIGSPCCPRDLSLDQKKQIRDILPAELARLAIPEASTSIWFLYTDRADHWDRLGRNDPQAFESWLTKAGYVHAQVIRFRGVRIDEYQSSRS